jgi:hypothetical protein
MNHFSYFHPSNPPWYHRKILLYASNFAPQAKFALESDDRKRDLSQSNTSESWQDERSLVDLLIVVTQLLLILLRERAHRVLEIALGVLAANHEADLARRVGGDGCVCVFDVGKDFLAVLLELGD